jgi:hypothetical protein
MLCQGLPSVNLTAALIDEQWEKWGWLCENKSFKKNEEDDTQTFRVK